MRKISGFIATLAIVLFCMSYAFSEGYVGRTVTIYRRGKPRPITGVVLEETDDTIKIKLAYGEVTLPRAEIERIVDGEKLIETHKSRSATCKTAQDWYELGMWAKKENLRKFWREDMNKAIKVDTDHEKARDELGYECVVNERGKKIWTRKTDARDMAESAALRDADRDAVKDRPWEDHEQVYYFPDKANAVYQIHTNCPEDIAQEYGKFMVKLKNGLTKMVAGLKLKKPVKWQNFGPGKIYICNSHKLFMEITGQTPGVGGFYTPGYFAAGGASRVIVAFHGTFGYSGDTFEVLAHEGTHQLQGRMWLGDFGTRPPWLIEGLAVYFGDGHKVSPKGEFLIDIPRDRLNNLRRGFATNNYIKMRDLWFTPYAQFGGYHYAHGWGLIYWMIHSGETLTYKGKTYNLREVFADFFVANLDQGKQAIWQHFGAGRSREEVFELADIIEEPWKRYLNSLTPPSVGKWTKKNRQKVFLSPGIGFALELPKGREGDEWQAVPELELKEGQLMAVKKKSTTMQFVVSQSANSENLSKVEDLRFNQLRNLKYSLENFKVYAPEEGSLADGTAVYTIHYSGKERKSDYNSNPYPEEFRASKTLYLLGKNYFVLTTRMDMSDFQKMVDDLGEDEAYQKYKEVFSKVLNGFGTRVDGKH